MHHPAVTENTKPVQMSRGTVKTMAVRDGTDNTSIFMHRAPAVEALVDVVCWGPRGT